MPKYNQYTQKKLEEIFKELDYKVRYEKGHFQSGYCIVENQKVIIINKFHAIEAKVNTLIEILKTLDLATDNLSESSKRFYQKIQ